MCFISSEQRRIIAAQNDDEASRLERLSQHYRATAEQQRQIADEQDVLAETIVAEPPTLDPGNIGTATRTPDEARDAKAVPA